MAKTIHDIFDEHLKNTPVCERCKVNPSVNITPFGKIEAACKNCIDKIWFEYSESVRISEEIDEEYSYNKYWK